MDRLEKFKDLRQKGEIESIFCDGVGYVANTKEGEEFLETQGEPHFCCGYHGWVYLLRWID